MSNIRQFPTRDESAGERINSQVKRRKQVRAIRILVVLILIFGAALAYYIYQNSKIYETYILLNRADRTVSEETKIVEFGSSIMTYGKDGAKAQDSTGKLLWNQTFDMQNPMMSICESTVAFADYGGSKIYIQTEEGETSVISTNMPIRKITVSDAGYVAAVLEDTNVTWIYMYDIHGTEISYFRTTMEKSGYPIDLDISPSGELIVVSYYYLDVGDVKSSVAFYNFGAVGQNSIDNYVSGYNYVDSLVPVVRFLDDETAFSLSSARLSVYAGAHKPVSISDMFLTSDVLSVYYSKDAVALITRNNSIENQYRLEIYDKSGKLTGSKEFDFDYSGVAFGNKTIVLYGGNSVYISTYDGKTKYEGEYSEPIHMMMATNSLAKYVVVTEKNIDTIEIK